MSQTAPNTAQQILGLAIAIERHNRDAFVDWANRFRAYKPAVAAFLDELAEEEREHERELTDIYRARFGNSDIPTALPAEFSRYHKGLQRVSEHFMLVDADSAAVVLQTALAIERYTREFYNHLLSETSDPDQAAVYERLSAYEAEHERQFQAQLDALTVEQTS